MLAFMLPDHGAETPGMGRAWAEHPSWELVDAASDAAGLDIGALLLTASTRELAALHNAQLATFVLSLVAVDAAERTGLAPMAITGYGLGEYTALVAAGALDFEDGVRLVLERGESVREFAMTPCATAVVLGLDDCDVEAACARAEGGVWVAGYDAPGRVVIAGTAEGVSLACVVATSLGATDAVVLPSTGGLHTPLLSSARDRLRKVLASTSFHDSDPVVVANVDARHHAEPSEWPGLLSAQLCAPVRWRRSVEALFEDGVRTFVEFGAGYALAEATRQSFAPMAVQTHCIASPHDLEVLVERLITTPSIRRTEVADHDQLAGRLVVVVSPGAGPFQPAPSVAHATPQLAALRNSEDPATSEPEVQVGELIGWVGGEEVRSGFAGTLGGLLVISGERVMSSQPVAWLRVA